MEALDYRQTTPVRQRYDETMSQKKAFWGGYSISTFVRSQSPQRQAIESYISQRFSQQYDATLTHFFDNLISVSTPKHCIGAIGVNNMAKHSHCFVEHYLDKPVEQILSACLGETITRSRLLEVGNLATSHPQSTWVLFVYVAFLMKHSGHDWAIITANSGVRFWLKQFNVTCVELGEATEQALPTSDQQWGRYYDEKPIVLAFKVGRDHPKLNHDDHLKSFNTHYLSDLTHTVAVLNA